MRWTFQQALHSRMVKDDRIVLLWCDVGLGLFKNHIRDFPARVINAGICEQATVSMAAGLAMAGFRPIVYTIAPFLLERAFEQIKLDVDQQNLPVGLVGVDCPSAGPTHRCNDAAALVTLCPNIQVHFPDRKEAVALPDDIDAPWFLLLRE